MNSIAKAFRSTVVDASLPTVIVLAEALVPILIVDVLCVPVAEVPIFMEAALAASIEKIPVDVIAVVVVESVTIVPAESNSIAKALKLNEKDNKKTRIFLIFIIYDPRNIKEVKIWNYDQKFQRNF